VGCRDRDGISAGGVVLGSAEAESVRVGAGRDGVEVARLRMKRRGEREGKGNLQQTLR